MLTQTPLSLEEFLELPSLDGGKRELLEGELLNLAPAKALHDILSDRLCDALKDYFQSSEQSRARVRREAGFVIPGAKRSWIQPEVSVLQPDHPIGADGYYFGPPMLAVEVVSKSNTARDIERKRRILLANGTREVWVVYPGTRTIAVERDGTTTAHRKVLESSLLPGFHLNLEELFRD